MKFNRHVSVSAFCPSEFTGSEILRDELRTVKDEGVKALSFCRCLLHALVLLKRCHDAIAG